MPDINTYNSQQPNVSNNESDWGRAGPMGTLPGYKSESISLATDILPTTDLDEDIPKAVGYNHSLKRHVDTK